MDFNNLDSEIRNKYDLKKEYTENFNPNGYNIYIYFGNHKSKKDDYILIKNIKMNINNIQNYEINQIKKDIILLTSLNNKNYFPNLINISLSNDKSNIYFIIKGNNISLDRLISSKIYDYKKEKNLIKYIIYQITYGLYILYSNNIILHNLKPLFILIDQTAKISIYNFLSAIYKGEKSIYFTASYAAPEIFISESNIDEKYDMWSLGVIMIELYLNQINFFGIKNKEEENGDKKINQIKTILSKFDIEEKNKYNDLNILLKDIINGKINAKFKIKDILNEINDLDTIELIENLLVINPNKRYSSEQVLKSKYLKEYEGLDSLKIEPINYSWNYVKKYNNIKGIDKFINIDDLNNLINNK